MSDLNPDWNEVERDARQVPIISVRDVVVRFGQRTVLDELSLDVMTGEVLGFVGGSGAGKSVLMRTIIGLIRKSAGDIEVLGVDMAGAPDEQRQAVERRWGVLFQHGALFGSLTVGQNVQFPLRENLRLSDRLLDEIAVAKLELVGLKPEVRHQSPSELSGGMIKRVALARALALDPDIVFLDEPTSGLDPIGAAEFDELIKTLQQTLGLTVFMVTHDLDSLYAICDRIAVLFEGKVIASGPMSTMLASEHPWLKAYFRGKRGRAYDGKIAVPAE
jgi:phospholipid/cholesterol/gamma-HCH transport system ATP-binding protein